MSAPADRYELYRVILDYEALQDGFLDRIDDLNTTLEQIEMAGDLAKGNAQKLLTKNPGKRVQRDKDCRFKSAQRTFGWESLGKMLKGTGLALVLVVDDERFSEAKEQLAQRKRPAMRSIVRTMKPKWLLTSEKARKISKNRWNDVPPEIRKKIMRKVAKARWRKSKRQESGKKLGLPISACEPFPSPKASTTPRLDCGQPVCLSPNAA